MVTLNLPPHLEDKIFEIRSENDENISKIVSYFPLNESEKQELLSFMDKKQFDGFHSIFTDQVTKEEWNRTKEQIKKKFRDELFDVDETS